MTKPRILIGDDHALVAEACKKLLEPEYEVIAMVGGGRRWFRPAKPGQRPSLFICRCGRYPWTVVRAEDRKWYPAVLDGASIEMHIRPFTGFIAERVQWSVHQQAANCVHEAAQPTPNLPKGGLPLQI